MHYIYAPDFNGGKGSIPGDELHHLRVKRIRDGEVFGILDGRGRITYVFFQGGRLIQECVEEYPEPVNVFICSPVPSGKRGSFLIEKLSEIGVKGFVPLITERGRKGIDLPKLQKYVIGGMKQSGNPWAMEVFPPMGIREVIRRFSCLPLYFGDREGKRPEMGIEGVFIVGPEGGFSEQEKEFLVSSGAKPLSVARYVLRVETAAIAFAILSTV